MPELRWQESVSTSNIERRCQRKQQSIWTCSKIYSTAVMVKSKWTFETGQILLSVMIAWSVWAVLQAPSRWTERDEEWCTHKASSFILKTQLRKLFAKCIIWDSLLTDSCGWIADIAFSLTGNNSRSLFDLRSLSRTVDIAVYGSQLDCFCSLLLWKTKRILSSGFVDISIRGISNSFCRITNSLRCSRDSITQTFA